MLEECDFKGNIEMKCVLYIHFIVLETKLNRIVSINHTFVVMSVHSRNLTEEQLSVMLLKTELNANNLKINPY